MKWIVYGLLAVNLGALAWNLQQRFVRPPPQPEAVAEAGAAHALPLLSELSERPLRRRGDGLAEGPTEREIVAVFDDEAEASGAEPGPSASCFSVGPLRDDAPVDALRVWFEGRGAAVTMRQDERREVAVWWVYFPPLESRDAAVARVARMRSEGVEDITVIAKGDMANAVSLGVFSRQDSVVRRLAELRAKGYQPSTVPRYRTSRAAWMDVTLPPDGLEEAAFSQAFPDQNLRDRPCDAGQIATSGAASYNSNEKRGRALFSGPAPATGVAPAD